MTLKKEDNAFHIGKLIRAQLKKVGMPISVIAGKLSIPHQKVYYLLNKKSIDAEKLQKISVVLDYDFFQHYLGLQKVKEGDGCDLFMLNPADVQRDLTIARNEMKVVLKHNGYLKEIIQLMDHKAELPSRRKFKSPNKPRKIKSVFKITTPVPENNSEVSPSRFIEY